MSSTRTLGGGLLAAVILLSACSGDSRKTSGELTADESAALLRDIRADPSRATGLTPREKKAVLKTLNGGAQQAK